MSFLKGVIHSSGQNKGLVLKSFLALFETLNFKRILFVDDNELNLRHMHEAFKKSSIEIKTFLFRASAEISE